MDRSTAHTILRTHLPRRDVRWLGLRRRCDHCGLAFPCPSVRKALDYLAGNPVPH